MAIYLSFLQACEQFRALAQEKKQKAEKQGKLLASSFTPPSIYTQLRSSDPTEVAQAEKQARRQKNISRMQAKVEFLESKTQMVKKASVVGLHSLELLRQDAARLTSILITILNATEEPTFALAAHIHMAYSLISCGDIYFHFFF